LEGLIELKNNFHKKEKNQQNKGQTEKNKTMENLILWWNWKGKKKLQQKCQGQN